MKRILLSILLLFFYQIVRSNGVVIINSSSGTTVEMLNSEVNIDVNNQVALVVSKQLFYNNTGNSFPISYGFPMPSNGSATQFRWRINDGEWEYASFSASEQEPPGGGGGMNANLSQYLGGTPLFFNFEDPLQNEDIIEIELTYVQLLAYKFDVVTFEYPSDYSLIQSSIIEQNQSIDFQLFSERTIESLVIDTYSANITNDGNTANLNYNEIGIVSLNNIKITYQLASDELGIISFSTMLDDVDQNCDEFGNGFLGLVIEPESNENVDVIEKVFTLIIDKSGSMNGQKMEQAKEAATFIVNNLNSDDLFNIISFSSTVNSFRPNHIEYNITNKIDALNYISNLNAGGGTNISQSLTDAIYQFGVTDPNKANMIIFFTDGQASSGETNTQGILNNVENAINVNETSIFLYTFGIGDNVNEQLLTLLALENNGLSEFVTNEEIESVISDFYLTIRNPVLLNTQIQFEPNIIGEIFPNPLPNLYKGQQLILTGRYNVPQDITVTLSGNAFNTDVSYTYDVSLSDVVDSNFAFLPKLWAKAKIENLQFLYYSLPSGSSEAESAQALIEDISLCYQVLSNFTSFNNDTVSLEDVFSEFDEFKVKFSPSPFSDFTKVNVVLPYPQEIIVSIYDVNGKLIKLMKIDGLTGGNVITWNGTNNKNKTVDIGVYYYRISTPNKSYFGKLIKK